MNEGKKEITLSKETQIEMLKFFLKTSIPRIKKEKERINHLSENEKR